jgi:hypothetical protein
VEEDQAGVTSTITKRASNCSTCCARRSASRRRRTNFLQRGEHLQPLQAPRAVSGLEEALEFPRARAEEDGLGLSCPAPRTSPGRSCRRRRRSETRERRPGDLVGHVHVDGVAGAAEGRAIST